jgi:hypothetical protein
MKRILTILVGFMLCIFSVNAQQTITRTMKGDSTTITVKFGEAKISTEQTTTQQQINALLNNSVTTNAVLATSIDQLTNSVRTGLELAQRNKVDKVAQQLNITVQDVYKSIKRNNMFKLVGLIPFLLVVFWAMYSFLTQKGLDIKNALLGTSLVTILAGLGALAIYYTLTLIFNDMFFVIRGLMFSS